MQSYRITMTSYSPRIYIYKITFEEVLYYYYGVHKEDIFDEEYWGSPYTNKWCWDFYTPKKQILEVFDYTDEGWIEANKVEKRIIKEFYNDDKWCLNENCAGIFSIEHQKKAGLKGGEKTKENGVGIFSLSKDERLKNSSRGGITSGNNHKKNKTGIFSITEEQRIENWKKSTETMKKNKTGFYGMSFEKMSEHSKKIASQKWVCLETGFISNAGALTMYQRAKGIDTSKRKRIE